MRPGLVGPAGGLRNPPRAGGETTTRSPGPAAARTPGAFAMNVQTLTRPAATAGLAGRVALVTGSTSGIGLGIARSLAAAGAAIVLNGFGKPEEVAAAEQGIAQDFAVPTSYSAADMSDPAAI